VNAKSNGYQKQKKEDVANIPKQKNYACPFFIV